jgi:hypothetical protein
MEFTPSERIYLKLHPELNEKWVQELIASDPSILGLGELVVRDKERIQPRAGRLDFFSKTQRQSVPSSWAAEG